MYLHKGVTAKNLTESQSTLVDESLELGPRFKVFKEESELNNHIDG